MGFLYWSCPGRIQSSYAADFRWFGALPVQVSNKLNGADFAKYDGGGLRPFATLEWENYSWAFAFIKASEGTVADPLFKRQWAAARNHTLRSAYHFFRPSVDPFDSVDALLELLDGDWGELPACFYLESSDNMRSNVVIDRSFQWLEEYERRTRIRPIIFSSPSFLDGLGVALYPKFGGYKLFLAQYLWDEWPAILRAAKLSAVLNETQALPVPIKPKPFTRMSFLRWTSRGDPKDVPGYFLGTGHKLTVSLVRYMGGLADFVAEFGVTLKHE